MSSYYLNAQQMASPWLDTDGVSVVISNIPPSVAFCPGFDSKGRNYVHGLLSFCLTRTRAAATTARRCTVPPKDLTSPIAARRKTLLLADVGLFCKCGCCSEGDIRLNICNGRCPLYEPQHHPLSLAELFHLLSLRLSQQFGPFHYFSLHQSLSLGSLHRL